MLRLALLIGLLVLAGCRREPSFDERYKAAQQRLDAKAAAIDRELTDSGSDAAAAASGS